MGFFTGLLVGLVTGAAAAVLYSVQTGRDLRQEFELMRSEIQQRDFEALGRHLEERFRELQAGLEERISQAREAASETSSQAAETVMPSAESTEETASPPMD